MSLITPSGTKTSGLTGMSLFDEIRAGALLHGSPYADSLLVPGASLSGNSYYGTAAFKNYSSVIVFINTDFIPANQLTGQSYIYDKVAGTLLFNNTIVTDDLLTIYVSNGSGAGSSAGGSAAPTAPFITSNPASGSVLEGDEVNFNVVATGTAPLTYQWRKDGVDIGGAILNTYTIASAVLASAAEYTCVVTNAPGSVASLPATLVVNAAGGTGGGSFLGSL
ncbi:MAG: immunoglobulin domain-containing protein [Chitinophagaceae bacterium]